MNARTEPTLYWVCVDCYFAHHGFNEHERGEDYPAETLSRIPTDADVSSGMMRDEHADDCDPEDECDCETQDFSSSWCDGCGSTLAGSRHALTIWTAP